MIASLPACLLLPVCLFEGFVGWFLCLLACLFACFGWFACSGPIVKVIQVLRETAPVYDFDPQSNYPPLQHGTHQVPFKGKLSSTLFTAHGNEGNEFLLGFFLDPSQANQGIRAVRAVRHPRGQPQPALVHRKPRLCTFLAGFKPIWARRFCRKHPSRWWF